MKTSILALAAATVLIQSTDAQRRRDRNPDDGDRDDDRDRRDDGDRPDDGDNPDDGDRDNGPGPEDNGFFRGDDYQS